MLRDRSDVSTRDQTILAVSRAAAHVRWWWVKAMYVAKVPPFLGREADLAVILTVPVDGDVEVREPRLNGCCPHAGNVKRRCEQQLVAFERGVGVHHGRDLVRI